MGIWQLRIRNKYFLLSVSALFLLIFIFFIMDDMNVLKTLLFGWKPEPEFTSSKDYMQTVYHYDIFVSMGSKPLQIILPVLSIIPTIHFKEELKHFFQHKFTRQNNYKREVAFSILGNAVLIAVAFYIAYSLAVIIGYFIFPMNELGNDFRSLFVDVLGQAFGKNNALLYYLLVGGIRILLPAFFYSLFSMSILIYSSKKGIYLFIPIIYHFFMMFFIPIINILIKNDLTNKIIMYFAPQILLAPGGLSEPITLMLFLGFIPYAIICTVLIVFRIFQKERVGMYE